MNKSCQELNGLAAPLSFRYERRIAERGDWIITAALERDKGKWETVFARVNAAGAF